MTVSYPLTDMPTSGMKNVTIRERRVQAKTESPFTLDTKITKRSGDRWEFDVEIVELNPQDAKDWIGWISALDGMTGTFFMEITDMMNAQQSFYGDGIAGTGTAIGDTSCALVTTPVNATIEAGDYFTRAPGGTESDVVMFKATRTVTSDGSGNCTLDFWPPMKRTFNNAYFNFGRTRMGAICRMTSPDVIYTYDNSQRIVGLEFSCHEVYNG